MDKQKASEILGSNILILDQVEDLGCKKEYLGLISYSFDDTCKVFGLIGHPDVFKAQHIHAYLIEVDGKYYFRSCFYEVVELIIALRVFNNYGE